MLLLAQESPAIIGGRDSDLVTRREITGREALRSARFSVATQRNVT